MPSSVPCPECKRLLKLPEAVLGQLVQCPSCSHTFIASEGPPPGRINERGEIGRPDPRDDGDDRPPRRGRYDDDYPRRPGGRERESSPLRGEVSGPANALLAVGVMAIIISGLLLVVALASTSNGGGELRREVGDEEQLATLMQNPCTQVIGLAAGVLITVGASRMKNLQNYGLAMTAGIVAMLPLHLCCPLGLPFGIWAVVVLSRRDVRDGFD